ncbi:MAG: ATP-binding protein [Pirellulales bacterium]|nr:ATP-binding protein [Pirellulales bacterium]
MIENFEKLGAFYLGKSYDLDRGTLRDELLLYDAKDLTTHAVCVGMTGSGKTGLCLSLLEEAAIDGVPAIAVDPKGDLGNLLLAFPNLAPDDFLPWIDPSDAARVGQTPEQYASQTATSWRDGLADWGQTPERIARYCESVDRAIYTPGSNAGLPLTVLRSFAAPPPEVRKDDDAMRDRVGATVSGLLALLDIDADPVRSREHILIATVLDRTWRGGGSLDIPGLIHAIQKPPFETIGVFDLETFYPADDRLKLCMQLNNLLASPSFAGWMEGEPLDIKRLLHTPEGKPRLSIISIAHLSEGERMFFVTILLNEVLAWVRTQPGTSSLRAILYMDEVFGYFPPVANPPSKKPMLTLLKQARAYGLGVVLATQNPVDLDYKGLSNAGTWLLGRLQTERDKARVLEGLEGASAQAGASFDRAKMEATLAGLGRRVFLMNNVHDNEPTVFQTRWAMSYLRGPLTNSQIERLMASRKKDETSKTPTASADAPVLTLDDPRPEGIARQAAPRPEEPAAAAARPMLPKDVVERFMTPRRPLLQAVRLVYRPALLARARLHFARATYQVDVWQDRGLLRPLDDRLPADPWKSASLLDLDVVAWTAEPLPGAAFAAAPAELSREKSFSALANKLKAHLYQNETLIVWKCEELKQYSEAGESEGDFRARLAHMAREARDLEVEKLRESYTPKLATLERRIRSAEDRLAREKTQARKASYESVVSIGSSLLGALLGRKLASRTNVSRAATSMRSLGRAAAQRGDIGQVDEMIDDLKKQLAELEQRFERDMHEIERSLQIEQLALDALSVRPRKTDIVISELSVAWLPWHVDATGTAQPAFSG